MFRQTNREYELVDWIQEAVDDAAGIIINPAAYTFSSVAVMDALKMFEGPVIEAAHFKYTPPRAYLQSPSCRRL